MVRIDREPRRLQRTRFTAEQHFDALDGDADYLESLMQNIRDEIKSLRAILISLLLTAAGAIVVGAINLFFGQLGGK